MTRCRRDLNLGAVPVDMMIPQDLQPLLSIRFGPIRILPLVPPFNNACPLFQNRMRG